MQTILGAGGAIGIELAKALSAYTNQIRLVSRNPQKVNEADQLFPADLLDKHQLDKAVKGSSIVYLTVGFTYNLKVWSQNWPRLIENLIASCEKHQCKLVFFDNIYMYDENYLDGMTEEAPINPSSKKGAIRAEIADRIMAEVKMGKLTALIARSADFYGPNSQNTSILTETVIKPLKDGKKANWLGPLHFKHSFTFTPDAGKATALLGNTPEAYDQVWHLPTASNPPTAQQWVEMIAKELGAKPAVRATPKWLVSLMGLFIPVMREFPEMMYQYNRNYEFDSSKFEHQFTLQPTPYIQGVKETLAAL